MCVCVWYKKMAALHVKRNGSFKKSDHTLKYLLRHSLIVNRLSLISLISQIAPNGQFGYSDFPDLVSYSI